MSTDRLLERLGYDIEERTWDAAESDDPEVLKRELRLQRVAAHIERGCRAERAVVVELKLLDEEDGAMSVQARIASPTGDRAQEEHLARAAVREALAHRFRAQMALQLVATITELSVQVEAGAVDPEEAWLRVEAGAWAALKREFGEDEDDDEGSEG